MAYVLITRRQELSTASHGLDRERSWKLLLASRKGVTIWGLLWISYSKRYKPPHSLLLDPAVVFLLPFTSVPAHGQAISRLRYVQMSKSRFFTSMIYISAELTHEPFSSTLGAKEPGDGLRDILGFGIIRQQLRAPSLSLCIPWVGRNTYLIMSRSIESDKKTSGVMKHRRSPSPKRSQLVANKCASIHHISNFGWHGLHHLTNCKA